MKEKNIEEDIKNIEEMLEFKVDIIKYQAWVGIKVINSVENLLTRYKQLQKENEELHKEIDRMKSLDIYKLVKDWETGQLIPIQKVKDKIEELKKKVEELTDEQGYWGGSDLLEQIKVLEEILEKEQ